MIAANQNKQPAITGIQNNHSNSMQDSQSGNVNNMLSIMTGTNDTDLNMLNEKSQ